MQRTPLPTDRSALDIRAIVSSVVPPQASVRSVQLLPHRRLQQVYEVQLSDMTAMLVVLPPLPVLRLLRSEQNMTRSEAIIIRWIRDELLQPSPTRGSPALGPHRPENIPEGSSSLHSRKGTGLQQSSRNTTAATNLRADLLQYLPSPISLSPLSPAAPADPSSVPTSAPSLIFNLFKPPPGTPIAALAPPLTPAERVSVDYQAGRLLRQLSRLAPRSGNFGPALAVLTPQSMPGSPHANDLACGMSSWSVAFHSILESILRDGEDVAVALAYPTIRKHFRRLGHLLDMVTTPSLVVVDAMDDSNLLVQRSPVLPLSADAAASDTQAAVSKLARQRRVSPTSSTTGEIPQRDDAESSPSSPPRESRSSSSPPFVEPTAGIVVTGLRDWSHCIFGDPLFASVFCEQPSPPFLSGFHSATNGGGPRPADAPASQEERDSKAVRQLLYQCYHAVVQIVRGFYRPGRDQTAQELAARKRLTEILAKLDAVDEDPRRRPRHRRPSGEMSPAKKPRSESGDEVSKR